jgi:N-acetylglucosamine-6-sulfatase
MSGGGFAFRGTGVRVAIAAAAAAAVIAGLLGSGSSANAGAGTAAPNVVVIQSDDQTFDSMRVMRQTTRLLGDRGATFRKNFTNWPVCCPSRATQLTGQYAHNHGVLGNKPPEGGYLTFPREDNLAVWLAEAGYRVGHVGKFLNGYGPRRDRAETPYNDLTEVPPGWTDWRTGSAGSTYQFYGYTQNEWSGGPGDPRDGELVPHDGRVRDYKTDANTRDALDLIEGYAGAGSPFYLQVDYLAPHSGGPGEGEMPHPPFNCTGYAKPAPRHAHAFDSAPLRPAGAPSFNEADVSDKPPDVAELERLGRSDIRTITDRYRCRIESLLAIDDGVRRIVDKLRAEGELGNTYIFYTSDNGFFHGEHRVKSGKNKVYEPSIHVPLLVRGPGIDRGVAVKDLTTNADFAATVEALTGATGRVPDGRSLLPAIQNPNEETGRELLIETNRYTAVRTQRYKWVENDDGFAELYDLRRDPDELRNRADDPAYADAREALADRLAALRDCAGTECAQTPALEFEFRPVQGGGGCLRGGLRVSVAGGDEGSLERLRVEARGDFAGGDDGSPFEVLVTRRELVGKGRAAVKAQASLIDGRRVTVVRSFGVCR